MAEDRIAVDGRQRPTPGSEPEGGGEGGVHALFAPRPDLDVIQASPHMMFAFGAMDTLPAPALAGTWWRIAYHFGARDQALALTIAKFSHDGGRAPLRISAAASVTCLVHEHWLANFDTAVRGDLACPGEFHLPSELRAIAAQALHYELTGAARVTYRMAKGLELLCETLHLSANGRLAPLCAGSGLSAADMQRLLSAKRTIAEQFEKKLTLDSIGRACGLNRAKLTRGFRTVFGVSIAEALSEERLLRASLLLRTTSKPVSTIGYQAGYLNNASFTRAFAKRFGVCPSEYRHRQLASAPAAAHRHAVAA